MRLPRRLSLSPANTLVTLFWLRGVAIAILAVVLAVVEYALQVLLPLRPIVAALAGLAGWNAWVYWRLRRRWVATELEVFAHLLVDVAILTAILYWSGGSTNPFVSFYLVPIAAAAVALRKRYLLAMTGACIVLYTVLMKVYVPLPHAHHDVAGSFQVHVFGMWVNFLFSAAAIALCAAALGGALRHRDALIHRHREALLRNEHVVAVGTLAAGAAHELGTPLATMALLLEELREALADRPALQADADLLKQQVAQCKASLSNLLQQTDPARAPEPTSVSALAGRVADRWRLMHPELRLDLTLPDEDPVSPALSEPTLAQSLLSLMNNAADASRAGGSDRIEMRVECDADALRIVILDDGPGLSEPDLARAGQVVFSTKPDGLGLGLYLSEASVSRLGGQVSLRNRMGGGTRTEVSLLLRGQDV